MRQRRRRAFKRRKQQKEPSGRAGPCVWPCGWEQVRDITPLPQDFMGRALLMVNQVAFWALGDNCSRKQEIHSGFVPVGPSEDKERAPVVPECPSTSSHLLISLFN